MENRILNDRTWPPKVLQSPMAGITDLAFRRIARSFGCELAFTEMVKDVPVVTRNAKTLDMVRTADWDHPLGMQLVGREPATMAEAARILEGLGADVIDVNLGCPVRKVVQEGCGAALLKEPERVGRIVQAMAAAVRVPVTVKMRTGFDSSNDPDFLRTARIAAESGARWITVHGRTRAEMYTGYSNHEAIRAVKEQSSVPVIGNGDIRSGENAARMFRETGCDGVMLARGSLGNPWIYREVASVLATGVVPPPADAAARSKILAEHFELLRHLYGDDLACRRVRCLVMWYTKGFSGSRRLRERANTAASVPEVQAVIRDFASEGAAALPASSSEELEIPEPFRGSAR